MRTPILATAAAVLCAPLSAQGLMTTSPAGLEFLEGGADSRDVVGTMPQLRYQQVDSTLASPIVNIVQLAFRRDGRLFTNPDYKDRTIDAEIIFAESSVDNISTTFASNYVANRTVVVTRKQINLPDWTQQPLLPPSQPDAIIPLDNVFSYLGKQATGNDFLWEVRIWSNTEPNKKYPFDFQYVVPNSTFGTKAPQRSGHIDLGRGCAVQLGESHLDVDVFNYGTKFTLDAHLHTANSAPVSLEIGVADVNLTHPSLCSKVHVLGGVSIPVGISGPNGDFCIDIDPIPYFASWIGLDLYFQSIAADPNQATQGFWPIALSSGAKLTIPGDPKCPAVGRVWAADPDATTATVGPHPGGIIAHLGQ